VRIARDSGAPIVPTFARREGDGYMILIEEPFFVPKTDNVEADVQAGLELLVAVLERNLRAAPDQWVMFQRVWTDEPRQAVRVFPVGSPLDGKILGPTEEERGPLTDQAPPRQSFPTDSSEKRPRPSIQDLPGYAERPSRDPSGNS
jgi:hypothetical protein